FILGRDALEVGARQIVEQHVELRAEEITPALLQMRKERLLVFQQPVQRAVKSILFHQPKIMPEQIAHGALFKPQPMQTPLAARVNQPITHQGLQNVPPASPFAAVRQTLGPEAIQPQLFVKLTRQPAGTPLTGPMQFHLIQLHLHAKAGGMFGHGSIRWKQSQWQGAIPLRIERFDGPAPTLALAVVDLAQIEHRTLHHLAARATPALDNAPVTMFLAVFEPPVAFQKHDGTHLTRKSQAQKGLGLYYSGF